MGECANGRHPWELANLVWEDNPPKAAVRIPPLLLNHCGLNWSIIVACSGLRSFTLLFANRTDCLRRFSVFLWYNSLCAV